MASPERMTQQRPLCTPSYQTATHANAVCTVPCATGGAVVVRSFVWSYSGGTPTGRLRLEAPTGNALIDFDITATGPGVLVPELVCPINTTLTATLYDGGSGIVGKLSLQTYQINIDGHIFPS